MKKTTFAIALAAFTGAGFVRAQPEVEPIPVPPPPAYVTPEGAAKIAVAQDQMQSVQRAMATTQKAMQVAQARAGEAGNSYVQRLNTIVRRGGSPSRALIIPREATDARSLTEVEEDLNVMAHILDKAASDDSKSARAMGIAVFSRGAGSSQNLFIEGYGAVLFLNVNFPLRPAPAKDTDTEKKEKPNSEWETARREMAQPAGAGGADAFVAFADNLERDFVWSGGPAAAYDADRVEELKRDLIAALKNAAHIRKLKSDETVTVVVTGASPGSGKSGKSGTGGGYGASGVGPATIDPATGLPAPRGTGFAVAMAGGEPSAPARMVLRARKADAEAFESGKLSLDDFKKKVTVMVY